MKEAVARMRSSKHHPNCIGVQFVQVGNDRKAKRVLEALVHGDNGVSLNIIGGCGETKFGFRAW